MDAAKKAIARTQEFVSDHKTAIAVAATATVAVVLHRRTVKVWNEFLETEGLMDKFYGPAEETLDI